MAAPRVINGVSTFTESRKRDKAELRAGMQESAHKYTSMLRQRLLPGLREKHPDKSEQEIAELLDSVQPAYQEYDPVIAMSLIAVDHANPVDLRLRAHAEVAQYTRPKLKSIEMTVDPASEEEQAVRRELANRLVTLLEAAAGAKAATTIEGTARRAYDPDPAPDDDTE